MRINTQNPQQSAGSTFALLDTDTYLMECTSASLEPNTFAEPNKDGSQPDQLVLVWELAETEERIEELELQGDEKVWQRINPFYGTVKAGGPSKFKALIDSLVQQGLLELDDEGNFDTDDLVGIKQKVSVEKYTKTMGSNVGQPGNRVTAVGPARKKTKVAGIKPSELVAAGVDDGSNLPF